MKPRAYPPPPTMRIGLPTSDGSFLLPSPPPSPLYPSLSHIVHSGYVQKKTAVTPAPNLPRDHRTTTFRPRFMIISAQSLYIFRSDFPDEPCLSAFPITADTHVDCDTETRCVRVRASERNWEFICKDSEELIQWVAGLRTTINSLGIQTYQQDPEHAVASRKYAKGLRLSELLHRQRESTPAGPTADNHLAVPTAQYPQDSFQQSLALLDSLQLMHGGDPDDDRPDHRSQQYLSVRSRPPRSQSAPRVDSAIRLSDMALPTDLDQNASASPPTYLKPSQTRPASDIDTKRTSNTGSIDSTSKDSISSSKSKEKPKEKARPIVAMHWAHV
ncbi:hypothetical protein BC832DRAFT_82331 [Gaertneriomyces semiglobifer]|nr:hypothetical protein BC832DRAFT_82331 [Gaertneriomyces semiglobifer]